MPYLVRLPFTFFKKQSVKKHAQQFEKLPPPTFYRFHMGLYRGFGQIDFNSGLAVGVLSNEHRGTFDRAFHCI
jgi:hypothetical protein